MVSSKVDEPRDEEEKDQGLLNRLHLRLHHRILGDAVTPTKGGERTGPEDGGEVAEDNERTTEQRFESRRVARCATPDALRMRLIHLIRLIRLMRLIRRACSEGSLQVRDLFREKWTSGYDWIYLFPTLCCVLLLLATYLPGPVPVFLCLLCL